MSDSPKGVIGVFAGATFIATAPIFAVVAHDSTALSPLVTAMWRTALAAPVLWGALAWTSWTRPGRASRLVLRHSGIERSKCRRQRLLLLLPGLFFAADLASWHTAMTAISAGGATFLANLAAVFVPIIAWVWLGERPSTRFFGGACLAVGGSALLLSRPGAGVLESLPGGGADYGFGNALGALTAVWYAAYQLSLRWVRRFAGALRVMAWTASVCGGSLALACFATGQPVLPSSASGWVPLVGMALFAQLIGQGLIIWSAHHVSASLLSVGLLWQPLSASLLAYVVLGQRLSTLQVAGVGVVLVGLLQVSRATQRRRVDPPARSVDPPRAP